MSAIEPVGLIGIEPMGLIGRKVGMTRIFTPEGESIPVTVIEVTPNRVCQIKSLETDWYTAIQVTTGFVKTSRINQAEIGHFAKASVEAGRGLWEFCADSANVKVGDEITVELFAGLQYVDVTGITKGKGFAGTVKRWHFRTQDATHGNSRSHRVPGSIGQNQSPGRVFKGKKMCGHMGVAQRTVQNLKVEMISVERNIILVRGAIPGTPGGDVMIRPAVKKAGTVAA